MKTGLDTTTMKGIRTTYQTPTQHPLLLTTKYCTTNTVQVHYKYLYNASKSTPPYYTLYNVPYNTPYIILAFTQTPAAASCDADEGNCPESKIAHYFSSITKPLTQ